MEVVGAVVILVAVADERVSTASALSAEGYGSVVRQLAVDEVHPRCIAVVLAIAVPYATVVAEVGPQRKGDGFTVGSRAAVGTQSIVHLQCRAAVAHQLGHGLLLLLCAVEMIHAGFRINGRIVG